MGCKQVAFPCTVSVLYGDDTPQHAHSVAPLSMLPICATWREPNMGCKPVAQCLTYMARVTTHPGMHSLLTSFLVAHIVSMLCISLLLVGAQ